ENSDAGFAAVNALDRRMAGLHFIVDLHRGREALDHALLVDAFTEVKAVVDGIASHRDAVDRPKPLADHRPDRVAAELAVRPLVADVRRDVEMTFQDDLGRRRHFDVDGLAFYEFHRLASERAGNRELVDVDAGHELR